jgi:hypothetical protein
MADNVAGQYGGGGLFGGVCFGNSCFFETLLMVIIIYWLLRWLFGWGYNG